MGEAKRITDPELRKKLRYEVMRRRDIKTYNSGRWIAGGPNNLSRGK